MRKIFLTILILFIFLITTNSVHAYSDVQIGDMVKPGIVHVLRTFSGKAQVPIVVYDAGSNQFRVASEEVLNTQFNENDIATGFIVNKSGYIVTDPYVMRENILKDILAEKFLNQVLDINLPNDEKLIESLLLQGKSVVAKNINIIENTENLLVVSNLFSDGVSAQLINKTSIEGSLSVPAIIKIENKRLPSLKIEEGDSDSSFYFNYANLLTKEFTSASFITTKVDVDFPSGSASSASFGGPVFSSNFNVVGMLTQDRELNKVGVLNMSKIISELKKSGIENEEGEYQKHMQKAFSFLEKTSCRKAIKEFEEAKKSTNLDVSNYVDSYIAQCNGLIASGRSKDTFSGFLRSIYENSLVFFVFIVIGAAIIFYWFVRVIKQILSKQQQPQREEDKNMSEDLDKE